jgi:hypothetical protein
MPPEYEETSMCTAIHGMQGQKRKPVMQNETSRSRLKWRATMSIREAIGELGE